MAFPDVNGDGVPDLVYASAPATAKLHLGDGDGRFGRRSRATNLSSRSIAVTDVDGDQLDDVVAVTADLEWTVLFGGDHQLAWGPRTPVAGTRWARCTDRGS